MRKYGVVLSDGRTDRLITIEAGSGRQAQAKIGRQLLKKRNLKEQIVRVVRV